MSDGGIEVLRLAEAQAGLYREIRLEALATAPAAFGSTHAIEAARPDEAFAERLRQAAVFAAFAGGARDAAGLPGRELLGIAGYLRMEGAKDRHKAVLWGMYVRPAGRGLGIGRALVRAVLAHAAGEVEQVLLTVVSDNVAARRLYAGLGFIEYGIEPRALRQPDGYADEVLMVRFLTPG